MAILPRTITRQTVEAIYDQRAAEQHNGFREHLGGSSIGKACARAIWYEFRWATRATHTGRLLRIFERGQMEEPRLVKELRSIGVTVLDVDPRTGRQWAFRDSTGHIGGSCDAVAIGLPEAPATWHLVEIKTHSSKSWRDVDSKGVRASKPVHFDQMQTYMGMAGLERAIYLAVNKDTEAIYQERLHFERAEYDRLLARAQAIVWTQTPPPRIGRDESFYTCRICDHAPVCWRNQPTLPHCRSCINGAPALGGKWFCEHHGRDMDRGEQEEGCDAHEYLMDMK